MPKLDAFNLKWIAIIGMITNHIVIAWWEIVPIWLAFPLYAAGGLTFPIMAFFIVEGYRHTSNLKRYLLRLFIFGVVAVPFHILTFRQVGFNIMFTIIVSILCLVLYDKIKIRPLFWLLFIVIAIATTFPFFFDWAFIGVIVVLLTHTIRDEAKRRTIPAIVAAVFMLSYSVVMILGYNNSAIFLEAMPIYDRNLILVSTVFFIGCVAAALLLKNFTGERGRRMKWMFYAFYPAHLAVLGLVALALGNVSLSLFGL